MNTLALDKQLCFVLYSASRAMTATYRELLAELGITYPQYLVMLVLWEEDAATDMTEPLSRGPADSVADGITVKALGERLQLDSGTLSPLLSRLENHGYVTRHRSSEDSRSVFVRLTTEGAASRALAECVPREVVGRTKIDPDELEKMLDSLQLLTLNLRAEAVADRD